MSSFAYEAVDAHGVGTRGTLQVADQSEAIRRVRQMGLFPTKVLLCGGGGGLVHRREPGNSGASCGAGLTGRRLGGKVAPAVLSIFTRQLATLLEAGMPVLRGLRVLEEQEENRRLKRVIKDVCGSIENGSALAEALARHPKTFSRLYLNMVRAGEIGGALDTALVRLAEWMEKSQRIRGKVKAAMTYPCAVMVVAVGILVLLMVLVVPAFKAVFVDLMNGASLPPFTEFVFSLSTMLQRHFTRMVLAAACFGIFLWLALRSNRGRWVADRVRLALPILGPLFRKAAISRFARTLGTLLANGVPVLQALTIVRETCGNLVLARVVSRLHESVKQGDSLAPTIRAAPVFPAMVAGMLDVGEQTGALPEMLLKVAATYDEQVDNAAAALTSLLEPVLILLLAVIVGSIVFAMFLPIVYIITDMPGPGGPGGGPGQE